MKSICQNLNGPLGSLKCLGAIQTDFPGLYFRQWDSEIGTFCGLINVSHQYWFLKAIILSVNQWFNACTVVRSGNFRASSRTGSLFRPNKNFLFLSNQQLLNFQSCFSFSEANCWASLAHFYKLSFGEISLCTMTEFWLLLVPLGTTFLMEMSARWSPLASRESSLECPRILIIGNTASKSIASSNSWT